jgi:hypothetical protein
MGEVAQAILEQLGGQGFLFMIGAKDLSGSAFGMSVKFKAKAKDGINCLVVTLRADDTYDMTFSRHRTYKGAPTGTVIKTYSEVYCDQLAELFRDTTGLETRMPRFASGVR